MAATFDLPPPSLPLPQAIRSLVKRAPRTVQMVVIEPKSRTFEKLVTPAKFDKRIGASTSPLARS